MLVTPPRSPARATGAIDRLLTELGHAPLTNLDEERSSLAESHDELFEEVAAFARRGWAYSFDAETGMAYDVEEYTRVLAEIVGPAGVHKVTFNDVAGTVAFDARTIHVTTPDQDDDWLDVAWIFEVANRGLDGSGWRLVEIEDADMHCVVAGVVPDAVWSAIESRGIQGAWLALAPFEDDYN